ncbi:MAG: hypothetical protein AUI47_04915 [Acidobacteria bacterium 13_1_40CM_2_68_5]|nr:MAG: hypothetical protein AUI47_04915 [Acidobacteria bacterium 13_1_40CM_2_68_5]
MDRRHEAVEIGKTVTAQDPHGRPAGKHPREQRIDDPAPRQRSRRGTVRDPSCSPRHALEQNQVRGHQPPRDERGDRVGGQPDGTLKGSLALDPGGSEEDRHPPGLGDQLGRPQVVDGSGAARQRRKEETVLIHGQKRHVVRRLLIESLPCRLRPHQVGERAAAGQDKQAPAARQKSDPLHQRTQIRAPAQAPADLE